MTIASDDDDDYDDHLSCSLQHQRQRISRGRDTFSSPVSALQQMLFAGRLSVRRLRR